MSNRMLLASLQEQCAFKLDVDVKKGERLTGNKDKTLYKARWTRLDQGPIVLIEKTGSESYNEIILNITLDHPHIIRTYGLVDPNGHRLRPDSVLLLQEYAKDGDLGGLLSRRHFIPQQNVLLEIFIQIANAMSYLSDHKTTHNDLACRNVLVFKSHPHNPKENLVKLIDFGLARDSSGSSDVTTDLPVRYAALEILRNKGRSGYSEKSDVYSFAVFMWEACMSGQIPYGDISDDNEVCRQKLEGKRLTQPSRCDPNFWTLMKLCWNDRPENRPNFQKICTQLRSIQKFESSQPPSNSGYSAFSRNDDSSSLFQVEYRICQNCHLTYTDYDSHLSNCSEHELSCETCFKRYRRGSHINHMNNCHGAYDNESFSQRLEFSTNNRPRNNREDISSSSSSPSKKRVPPISKPDIHDSYDGSRSSNNSYRGLIRESNEGAPGSSKQTPSPFGTPPPHQKLTPTLRTSGRKDSPQRSTEQLPCEVCNKLFDLSELRTHQKHCLENDKKRVERQRQRIEQQDAIEEVSCEFCSRQYPIDKIDEHQDTCQLNPANISDESSSRSSTRWPKPLHDSGLTESVNSTDEPAVPNENRSFIGRLLSSLCPCMKG